MNSIDTRNEKTGNAVTVTAVDNYASYLEILPDGKVLTVEWTLNGNISTVVDLSTGDRHSKVCTGDIGCLDELLDRLDWFVIRHSPAWVVPQKFGV